MSVPAVRRIIVGVDGSTQSAAALRWACREASLRGAEVHAVHVREERCHSLASYAVPASRRGDENGGGGNSAGEIGADDLSAGSVDDLLRSVEADQGAGVRVRVDEVDGLPAKVLLDRCEGADMLVLGTSSDTPGAVRSAGPVIRACLRRAPCPVVVIGAAQDPMRRAAEVPGQVRVDLSAGLGVPAGV
ncbi:MAG TPA: universal stress protein [Trebonia sp.]|nr:universal stress protein [Trebonia sp.]